MTVRSLLKVPLAFRKSLKVQRPSFTFCTATSSQFHNRSLGVQVGASLQLRLAEVNADVDIGTGDNLEQIEIKSLWHKDWVIPGAFEPIVRQDNCICVDLQTSEAKQFLEKLEAVMPNRWCNLLLSSGKGHVTVQNMKEADLNIVTRGGNVTLGEVRGNQATVKSNGGSLNASLIIAAIILVTNGGNILLDKVIGSTLKINSGGGVVKVQSAYGEDMIINSGGGCISIKHLQSQKMCHVTSNGGHVHIDGLDGNAIISTKGGNLHLQLLTNAKQVKVIAGTGEVTLFMPSEESSKFRVEHIKKDETCDEDLIYPRDQESMAVPSKESCLPACNVSIFGSGKVKIAKRSWLESVMQTPSISKRL